MQSQTSTDNHRKYWYYKTRLNNDFVLVGTGPGKSLPFSTRAWASSGTNANLEIGDGTSILGYYIAMLATEYYLLAQNSQNTNTVKHELFCALDAINRLDYRADSAYGGSFNLNGFFVRDDIPKDFARNNYDHFNYYSSWDHISTVWPGTDPDKGAVDRGFHSKATSAMYKTNSSWQDRQDNNGDISMSQDQVYNLLFGIAMVNKFVPDWETDGTNTFGYGSGLSSLTDEARNISGRIIDYMRQAKDGSGNACSSNPTGWIVKNSVSCNSVPHGSNAIVYSYPMAESECILRNNGAAPLVNISLLASLVHSGCGTSYHNWYSLSSTAFKAWNAAAQTNLYNPLRPNVAMDTRVFNANLMAICNCAYGSVADAFVNTVVSYLQQIPVLNWLGIIISWTYQLVSQITSLFVPGYYFNDTFSAINQNCYINGSGSSSNPNGSPGAPLDHGPLARKVLHGGLYTQNPNYNFDYLLDCAPCDNIYNYNNYNYGHYEWSSDSRLDHPNRRGWYGTNNPLDDHDQWRPEAGEYNGIDYMLYHNLWYIHKLQQGQTVNTFVEDYSNIYLNSSGGTISPGNLNAYETIKVENSKIDYSSTTAYWRAGKEIYFPGNDVEIIGSQNLHAYIQKFDCATDNGQFRPINGDSSGNNLGSGPYHHVDYPKTESDKVPASDGDKHFQNLITELPRKENPLDKAMKEVYPNFSRELFIKPTVTPDKVKAYFMLEENEEAFLQVTDLSGKIIFSKMNIKKPDSGMNIDLSPFNSGVYVLKFTTTKGTSKTQKIIKE
jgi:hypothetical protein